LDDPHVATPAPQRGFSFYRGLDSSNRFKPCTPVRILRLTKGLKRGHSNLSAGRSSNSVDMTSRVPSPIDSSVPRWESDRKGRPSIVSAKAYGGSHSVTVWLSRVSKARKTFRP